MHYILKKYCSIIILIVLVYFFGLKEVKAYDYSNRLNISSPNKVNQKNLLSVNADIINVSCTEVDNGEIFIIVDGGTPPYAFIWSTASSSQNIHNLVAGDYELTVTDNSEPQNVFIQTYTVLADTPPILDLGTEIDECVGVTVYLDAGNPSCNYLWSTGETSQIIEVNIIGEYSVTISNSCGSLSDTVFVNFIDNLEPVFLGNDTIICAREPAILYAGNPGADYLWSTGDTLYMIYAGNEGIYSVTVTNMCDTVTDEIQVSLDLPLDFPIDYGEYIHLCEGDSVVLTTGNPHATNIWSTGDTTASITITSPGTYYFHSFNHCDSFTDTIIVNFDSPIPTIDFGNDTTICATEPIVLHTGSEDFDYIWSTGETGSSITVTTTGTYYVYSSNECGSMTDTIYVIVDQPLEPVDFGDDTRLCEGESIVLDAGNSWADIIWTDGSTQQTITITQTGTYGVMVSNACGIVGDTIDIVFDPVLDAVNLGPDIFRCDDLPVILDAGEQDAIYIWSTGETSQTISVTESGLYSVILMNSCGFVQDEIFIYNVEPLPEISLGPDFSICDRDTVELSPGSLPGSYYWSTGETTDTIRPIIYESGYYSVTVSNICGSVVDSIYIERIPPADIRVLWPQERCVGDYITLYCGNEGLSSYNWSLPDGTIVSGQSVFIDSIGFEHSGTYTLLLEDTVLCNTSTYYIVFGYPEDLEIELKHEDCFLAKNGIISFTSFKHETQLAILRVNSINHFMDEGINNITLNNRRPELYIFSYTENEVCYLRDTIEIFRSEYICPDNRLWIPDAFTPNGDGINDVLSVFGNNVYYFHMIIYNRLGHIMYEYRDMDDAWDGTYRGEMCQNGMYVYFLQVFFNDGSHETRHGKVNLIR